MHVHSQEIERGDRFRFGENWSHFLSVLNDERIVCAEESLKSMLKVESLQGKSFLDIGSGSGLFSLAARRLGASVHSFDYDPQSIESTNELKKRYYSDDVNWTVEEGSALDEDYVKSLGKYDVVYSWGVLHHTGNMLKALENASIPVADGGKLFIAIYNDQGSWSNIWLKLKRIYNKLPGMLKLPYTVIVMGINDISYLMKCLVRFRVGTYIRSWTEYQTNSGRGMSRWHDIVDWIGGYPFEVAKPEVIFDLYKDRGFQLEMLKTVGGALGCNEFVFRNNSARG